MQSFQTEIFNAAEKRLRWADQRQMALAQNIANYSTPGYQTVDAPDFQQVLAGSAPLLPVRTAPTHLAGTAHAFPSKAANDLAVRTPDKNSVSLEQQLMKVADTETIQATTLQIFKKYITMYGEALGKAS